LYKEWKDDNPQEVFSIASRAISDSTVWMTWQDINKWSDKFSEGKATAFPLTFRARSAKTNDLAQAKVEVA